MRVGELMREPVLAYLGCSSAAVPLVKLSPEGSSGAGCCCIHVVPGLCGKFVEPLISFRELVCSVTRVLSRSFGGGMCRICNDNSKMCEGVVRMAKPVVSSCLSRFPYKTNVFC